MNKLRKIVIVDDNKDYLFATKTLLTRNGYEVMTAEDGKVGIELIKKEKPDLVLLDVMMETLFSGFEVCRQLKQDTDLKSIPVISISGMGDEINVQFNKDCDNEYFSPDEFLEKPVDRDLLLRKISGLLS
jgi:CheY-like chemotaxis protein